MKDLKNASKDSGAVDVHGGYSVQSLVHSQVNFEGNLTS